MCGWGMAVLVYKALFGNVKESISSIVLNSYGNWF